MKFCIEAKSLLELFESASKVAGTRSPLPIMHHALVRAEDDRVTVIATDLEQSILCSAAAVVVFSGAVCMPVKAVTELLSRAKSEQLSVTAERASGEVTIQGKRLCHSFSTLPAEEHPGDDCAKTEDASRTLTMAARHLLMGIQAAESACETDRKTSRVTALCVRFEGGNQLGLLASDGRRATLVSVQTGQYVAETLAHNAHTDFVKVLCGMLKAAKDGDVTLSWPKSGVLVAGFSWGRIWARTIESDFPAVRRIWAEPGQTATGQVSEWVDALRRLLCIQELKDQPASVRMRQDGESLGGVDVKMNNSAQDRKGEEVVTLVPGSDLWELAPAHINAKYLLEAIDALPVSEFSLGQDLSGGRENRRRLAMMVQQSIRDEDVIIKADTIIMEIKDKELVEEPA